MNIKDFDLPGILEQWPIVKLEGRDFKLTIEHRDIKKLSKYYSACLDGLEKAGLVLSEKGKK